MYKKSSAKKQHNIPFKPKKMILNGVVYDVDSLETLNKIRSNIEVKKKDEFDILEEQKNQKVLVKRTRNKNTDDKIIKIITDISNISEDSAIKARRDHLRVQNKIKLDEINKKPKLNIISTASNRRPITKNNLQCVSTQEDDDIQCSQIINKSSNINNVNDVQLPLNILKHDKMPLRKLEIGKFDNATIMQNDNQIMNNKIINLNKTLEIDNRPKTLSVVSRERRPLNSINAKNNNDINDINEDSDNNDIYNNTRYQKEEEYKPRTLNVTRREITKIKPLMSKYANNDDSQNIRIMDESEDNNDNEDNSNQSSIKRAMVCFSY